MKNSYIPNFLVLRGLEVGVRVVVLTMRIMTMTTISYVLR